jgi:hypothetical protein
MPVAHPGCPMDHIQALANRSPGDLWVRCVGTLFHLLHRVFSISASPIGDLSPFHLFLLPKILRFTRLITVTGDTLCRDTRPDVCRKTPRHKMRSPRQVSLSGERWPAALQTVSIRTCCAGIPALRYWKTGDTGQNPHGRPGKNRPGEYR